jgi:hypothetical protein
MPEDDRPFREWPLEQLAEQAILHASNQAVLARLAHEVAHRPGTRARALLARLQRLQEDADAVAAPRGMAVAELRELLASAAAEIARLRAALAEAETRLAEAQDGGSGELGPHRRVYLTPDAPAWLVTEVRRAFRRRYHPDSHGNANRRSRAEEVFKRAEAVFAEIEGRG